MEPTITGLRVLRAIAESGSFTVAATQLGFTQSAVSRQLAALERQAGHRLVDRRPGGARLTARGATMLRHARRVLDEIDAAVRDMADEPAAPRVVRLGTFPSAGATVVPGLLRAVREREPRIEVRTRSATSPALVRAVRAGTLDVAVVSSRPPHRAPDAELPPLETRTLGETELTLAVPALGRFAGRRSVSIDELRDVPWIAGPSRGTDPLLGVWPGLPGRPTVAHVTTDWHTKLRLVAGGCGVTTVPRDLAPTIPPGVLLLRIDDAPPEVRRLSAVLPPGAPPPAVLAVVRLLERTTAA